ncbi:MAG: PilW family protein [Pseudomonadota bacterium]
MKHQLRSAYSHQRGLGLPEIMVGLAIGLIVTIVIVQVMGVFEGQKRTTGGNTDAQTNGSIGLSVIQRKLQAAGFGLPIYSTVNPALRCNPSPTFDDDGDPATPPIGIFPVAIKDNDATAYGSDIITIRGGTSSMGGAPISISNVVGNVVSVTNNLGCANGDIALVSSGGGAACTMRRVVTVDPVDHTQITMDANAGLATGATLACMGTWSETVYKVDATGNLTENGASAVAGIVNIQAQYGISPDLTTNQVNQWVDATSGGSWETPTVDDRNRIKAIRIAVVARNSLLEKEVVTYKCSSTTAASPTGLCAWEGTAANPAPTIDLTAYPKWDHYRYRVFETIIPLRNILWSKALLK